MIILNKGLDPFFHSLIPSNLQRAVNPSTVAYIRVRSLSTMLVMITAISLISNLLVGGSHLLFQPEMLKYDLVSLVILLLLLLQTWLFYRFQNDWISGIAFTNFYFLIAVVMVLLSGGYNSHCKAFLLSCPIISFLIGGRQEGIQNTVFLILVCWALAALDVLEFSTPNIFEEQSPLLLFGVNWLVTVLIIAIVLVVYETELYRRMANRKPFIQRAMIQEVDRRVYAWLDRIVPAVFRTALDHHSLMYTRIQVMTVMLLLGTLVSGLLTIFFITYHLLLSPQYLAQDAIAGLVTLSFIAQLFLLYRGNNYRLSSVLISSFYSIMIFALVIISGGYQSPFMVLLLTCPIVSFMINGIRGGALNAVCIAGIGVVLGYLEFSGKGFVNQIANISDVLFFSIIWPVIVTGIAICMTLYDMELEKP